MEDVIKLPATEDKPAAAKRRRAAAQEPGGEERKRQKNASLVSVLGEEDRSVKVLEELVFGAEDELLGRLVSPPAASLGQTRAIEAHLKGSRSSPGEEERVPQEPAAGLVGRKSC